MDSQVDQSPMQQSRRPGISLDRDVGRSNRPGPSANRYLAAILLRYLIYFLVVGAVLAGFLRAIQVFGISDVIGEKGPLELVQVVLLAATSFGLLLAAHWMVANRRKSAVIFRLLVILVWILIARELDSFFNVVFEGAWKIALALMFFVAAVYTIRHRRGMLAQIPRLLPSRSFGLLLAAFLWVIVASPLMGQQVVWESALGEAYERRIARIIEELGELVGYVVLLLASIEACFEARMVRRNNPDLEASRAASAETT